MGGVQSDENQARHHIENRHDGDELLRDGRDALDAAHEDGAGDNGKANTDDDRVDIQGVLEGVADGVGLNHVAHEPKGQDDGDGEEAREELRDGPVAEPPGDVVGRAADDLPRLVLRLIELRQAGLAEVGGHAEKRGDPHPEDGSRASADQGGHGPHQVARPDLGSNGRGQGLERAHPGLSRGLAEEREVSEELTASRPKLRNLDEPQAEREEDPRTAEKGDQKLRAPKERVGLGDPLQEFLEKRQGQDFFHNKPTPF